MNSKNQISNFKDDSQTANDVSSYKTWAIIKLFIGFIALLIGILLTINSTNVVYYGAVFVGLQFILSGLLNLSLRKSSDEINYFVKILPSVVAFIITMSFLFYMM